MSYIHRIAGTVAGIMAYNPYTPDIAKTVARSIARQILLALTLKKFYGKKDSAISNVQEAIQRLLKVEGTKDSVLEIVQSVAGIKKTDYKKTPSNSQATYVSGANEAFKRRAAWDQAIRQVNESFDKILASNNDYESFARETFLS